MWHWQRSKNTLLLVVLLSGLILPIASADPLEGEYYELPPSSASDTEPCGDVVDGDPDDYGRTHDDEPVLDTWGAVMDWLTDLYRIR